MTSNLPDVDGPARGSNEVRTWTQHLLSQARAISQTLDNKVRTLLSRQADGGDDQGQPGGDSEPP